MLFIRPAQLFFNFVVYRLSDICYDFNVPLYLLGGWEQGIDRLKNLVVYEILPV